MARRKRQTKTLVRIQRADFKERRGAEFLIRGLWKKQADEKGVNIRGKTTGPRELVRTE